MSAEAGEPVGGAFVTLRDLAGDRASSTVSGTDGAFRLRAPGPGSFRLEVRRIGYQAARSEPLSVGPGEHVFEEVRLSVRPVGLADIRVTEERVCGTRPEEGSVIARVWERARDALEVMEWAYASRVYRYDVEEVVRLLDPRSLAVRRRVSQQRQTVSGIPYRSLPPDSLEETGYVARKAGRLWFYGPDATVLLADSFWAHHCFSLADSATGDGARSVGLRFRPVPGRSLPEVAGVLWLEAETGALQEVEFRYVNMRRLDLDGGTAARNLGGRVTFRQLPEGPWLVDRWSIRAPVLGRTRAGELGLDRELTVVEAIRERQGRVLKLHRPGAPGAPAARGATVFGVVYDSAAGGPRAGVTVAVAGGGPAAATDSLGRFRLRGVRPGTRTLRAESPELGALGAAPGTRTLMARPGGSYRVRLATPSRASVRRRACGVGSRGALIGGRVYDGSGGPVPGAQVRALATAEGGEERRAWWTVSDSAGAYRLCGVPDGSDVQVVAEGPAGAARSRKRLDPPSEAWRHDLHLSAAGDEAGPPEARLPDRAAEGGEAAGGGLPGDATAGRIAGTVRSGETGAPVEGGAVLVTAAGRTAPVGDDGEFALGGLPAGDHTVRVAPAGDSASGGWSAAVRVAPGRSVRLQVTLPGRGPVPSSRPARIRAETRWTLLEEGGFYRRRAEGDGRFLTREESAAGGPEEASARVDELLDGVRNPRRCGAGPSVYRDGRRVAGPELEFLADLRVTGDALLAVEAYRSGRVPDRFRAEPGCGAIALWTLPGAEVRVIEGGPARDAAALSGRVVDRDTGEPVGAASILLADGERTGVTDPGGRFRLEPVSPGIRRVVIGHAAYGRDTVEVEVRPGRTAHLELEVGQRAFELEPLTVTVEHRSPRLEAVGFYGRERTSSGIFLDREEIEESHGYELSSVLGSLQGIRMIRDCIKEDEGGRRRGRGLCSYFPVSTRRRLSRAWEGRCQRAKVLVDGLEIRLEDAGVDLVNLEDVAAVEVYRSPLETPLRFMDDDRAHCGVVVIWTGR